VFTDIHQSFDGETDFSILSKSQNLQKFMHTKIQFIACDCALNIEFCTLYW